MCHYGSVKFVSLTECILKLFLRSDWGHTSIPEGFGYWHRSDFWRVQNTSGKMWGIWMIPIKTNLASFHRRYSIKNNNSLPKQKPKLVVFTLVLFLQHAHGSQDHKYLLYAGELRIGKKWKGPAKQVQIRCFEDHARFYKKKSGRKPKSVENQLFVTFKIKIVLISIRLNVLIYLLLIKNIFIKLKYN